MTTKPEKNIESSQPTSVPLGNSDNINDGKTKEQDKYEHEQPQKQQELKTNNQNEVANENNTDNRGKKFMIYGAVCVVVTILIFVMIAVVPVRHCNKRIKNEESSPYVGPFVIDLPLYSPETVTQIYPNSEEASQDFEQVAKSILNLIINTQLNVDGFRYYGGFRSVVRCSGIFSLASSRSENEVTSNINDIQDVGNTIDDFATNNQEQNVDQGDHSKSDGAFIYTAFGDYLVILKADNGNVVLKLQMPEILPIDGCDETNNGCYRQKPIVQSLLLAEGRLAVVLSGNRYYNTWQTQGGKYPILNSYKDTTVRLYDTTQLMQDGTLSFIGFQQFNGYFKEGYVIDNKAHIVTTSGFNTFPWLVEPLLKNNKDFDGLSNNDYVFMAESLSFDTLIPDFVAQLVKELSFTNNEFPHVAQITMLSKTLSTNQQFNDLMFANGVVSSIVQITSFDMLGEGLIEQEEEEAKLDVSISVQLIPSSWIESYSNEDMIIVGAQGSNFVPSTGAAQGTTYLFGYELDGTTSTIALSGVIPGYLLSSYSIDFLDGYLRVASTLRNRWFIEDFIPISSDDDSNDGESSNDFDNGGELSNAFDNDIGKYYEISNDSNTLNQVFVLSTSAGENSSELEIVGNVVLGKPNEEFTAIRFFDDIAYAVTFEQRDPFYVLSFEDPTTPVVLGELDVTGFSSYLHSMNTNNTLIIGVGREANNNGNDLGLQISVFDNHNPANPTLLHRHLVGGGDDGPITWTNTNVQWDEKSFRYLKLSEERGRLIIPLQQRNWEKNEYFDGFAVFAINPNGIFPVFEISHVDDPNICYYCGYVKNRSFVFDGNVVTLHGRSARSTNLDSGLVVWKADFTWELEECCSWWY